MFSNGTMRHEQPNGNFQKGTIRSLFVQSLRFKVPLIILIVSLFGTFPYHKSLTSIPFPHAGEIAQQTIIAPFNIDVYKSESEYQREIRAAELAVTPIFRKNKTISDSVKSALREVGKNLDRLSTNAHQNTEPESVYTELRKTFTPDQISFMLSNRTAIHSLLEKIVNNVESGILSHTPISTLADLEQYREEFEGRIHYVTTASTSISVISNGIETNYPRSKFTNIPDLYALLFEEISGNQEQKALLASTLFRTFTCIVKPTIVYDPRATEVKRATARESIKKISRTIPRNVEIVFKNQLVTPAIEENLSALNQQLKSHYSRSEILKSVLSQGATLGILVVVSVILIIGLRSLCPRGIQATTYFHVLSLTTAISLIVIRLMLWIMTGFSTNPLDHSTAIMYTAVPMIVGPLVTSALFNKETGFLLTIFFSFYGGIIGGYDPILPLGIFICGSIASGLASTLRYRKDFLSLVSWIGIANILIGFTMLMADGTPRTDTIVRDIFIFSCINTIATGTFSFLLLPLFEQQFHLTTDMTLMELADMNHPLLKRLAIEAPGTYNHSIMVANLAEAAANAIGADGLLCRVVSYYHDIGKLKKPHYFIENQYSKRNVHDKLSPSMSVRIITGHIREGLELAEQYRLPQAIKDIIPQHHGDAPISFFYHKAVEEKAENTEIDIRDYSYSGPKPQTRENAVVMIADSVEAASRTLKNVSIKDVREVVRKLIWVKVSQNQFDECGLTLSELSEIINGMMPILEGIFHSRIEYPEDEEREDG